jgi:predicted PurR-regulated permease PerM
METYSPSQSNPAGVDTTVEAATRAVPSSPAKVAGTAPLQIVLVVLGVIAFLYFARPVVLPVFLACAAGMTLKPLIRWMSCRRGEKVFRPAKVAVNELLTS